MLLEQKHGENISDIGRLPGTDGIYQERALQILPGQKSAYQDDQNTLNELNANAKLFEPNAITDFPKSDAMVPAYEPNEIFDAFKPNVMADPFFSNGMVLPNEPNVTAFFHHTNATGDLNEPNAMVEACASNEIMDFSKSDAMVDAYEPNEIFDAFEPNAMADPFFPNGMVLTYERNVTAYSHETNATGDPNKPNAMVEACTSKEITDFSKSDDAYEPNEIFDAFEPNVMADPFFPNGMVLPYELNVTAYWHETNAHAVIIESFAKNLRAISNLPDYVIDFPWFVDIKSAEEVESGFATNLYNTNVVVRIESAPVPGVSYLSLWEKKTTRHYRIQKYQCDNSYDFESVSRDGYYHLCEYPFPVLYFLNISDLVETYSSPPSTRMFSKDLLQDSYWIGNGTFGDVFLGKWNRYKRPASEGSAFESFPLIIKRASKNDNTLTKEDFFDHAIILGTLSHPHIVTFYGMCPQLGLFGTTHGILFQEFVESCNLRSFLRNYGKLNLYILTKIISQVADGLEYLESRGIFYRNLSLRNVRVITSNMSNMRDMIDIMCKITDFGFEKMNVLRTDEFGNFMYSQRRNPMKNDAVAFGILMYQVFSKGIYSERRFESVLNAIELDERFFPVKPASCPLEIYNVIVKCWKIDIYLRKRPYFTDLKNYIFRYYNTLIASL